MNVSADWYDEDWNDRIEFNIENKIMGYQTMINLSYEDDLNSDCNMNFSDLRFVTENGTLLPYWIDEKVNGSFCLVWFNNVFNDSSLYIYYNNMFATCQSNITSVWDYCDLWTSDLTSQITPYQSWYGNRFRTFEENTSLDLNYAKMIIKYKVHTYDADYYGARTGFFRASGIPDSYSSSPSYKMPNNLCVVLTGKTIQGADDDNYNVAMVTRDEDDGNWEFDNGNVPYDQKYHKIMMNYNETRAFVSVNDLYWSEFKNETNNQTLPSGDLNDFAYHSDAQDVAGSHYFNYDSSEDALDIGAERFGWNRACIKTKIKYICLGKFVSLEPSVELETSESMEPSSNTVPVVSDVFPSGVISDMSSFSFSLCDNESDEMTWYLYENNSGSWNLVCNGSSFNDSIICDNVSWVFDYGNLSYNGSFWFVSDLLYYSLNVTDGTGWSNLSKDFSIKNDLLEEDEEMNVYLMDMPILINILLFFFFLYIGYSSTRRSAGLFIVCGGMLLFSLEGLLLSYLSSFFVIGLLSPIAIFLLFVGIKQFLYDKDEKENA